MNTDTRQTLILVTVATAIAWLLVIFGPTGMGAGVVVFVAAWTVMMVAMMLPSATPFILLYRRGATPAATAALAVGYLLVWGAAGVPAYFADALVPMSVGPFVLAAAGVYQLTPLKSSCLTKCRSPGDFLVQRWGGSALRLGIEHGAWCLGCCWALMAVLVLAGAMGLAWVVGVTTIVALEKLSPRGFAWSRITGVALLVAALLQGVGVWPGESMDMS